MLGSIRSLQGKKLMLLCDSTSNYSSSVNLLWEVPNQSNGRITGYEIRYRRSDQSEAQAISTVVRHNLYEFSANSLVPNTTYLFAIKAETQAGWGDEIEAPVFTSSARPLITSPPVPERNAKHAPSATDIWIKWAEKRGKNEPLNGREAPTRAVEVEFQRANDPTWTLVPYSIRPHVNEVLLDE
jgi:hypothetical protein